MTNRLGFLGPLQIPTVQGIWHLFNYFYPSAVLAFAAIQALRLRGELIPAVGFLLLGLVALFSLGQKALASHRASASNITFDESSAAAAPDLTTIGLVLLLLLLISVDTLALAGLHWQDVLLDWYWLEMYRTQPEGIRDLESAYRCCGYRSLVDKDIPKVLPPHRDTPNNRPGIPHSSPRETELRCHLNPDLGYQRSCFSFVHETYHEAYMGLIWFTSLFALYQGAVLYVHLRQKSGWPVSELRQTNDYRQIEEVNDGEDQHILGRARL
ncbi:hypothetical protein H4R33_007063 [Dimargaris cristalligena]|uniref:Tetraspanin family-domain-containing protein n=1 Tax=Dimargaris cristalligena TaxID=215637 RepID=A0A4P9ZPY4_9FUNG|nr:hypothetical protein H4R33_007063 [Dimargaris cristalligena]RKP34410.1 hypothetical protein BJ085DRAFT_39181 [Dimargaris cristalligena]|eukprot:RKP34410.1 hypothetical protein BJ085DRAFT_39181 [Dimargaris cristalligena]